MENKQSEILGWVGGKQILGWVEGWETILGWVEGWETILGWVGRSAMVPYMSHDLTPLKDPGHSGM